MLGDFDRKLHGLDHVANPGPEHLCQTHTTTRPTTTTSRELAISVKL